VPVWSVHAGGNHVGSPGSPNTPLHPTPLRGRKIGAFLQPGSIQTFFRSKAAARVNGNPFGGLASDSHPRSRQLNANPFGGLASDSHQKT
jgi:hypothetical protein